MIRGWQRLLAILMALTWAGPLAAHLTPNSELRLRFEPGVLRADVLIPVAEFTYATGLTAGNRQVLIRYLADRTGAIAPDGRRWSVLVDDLRVESAPGGPDIRATISYTPPAGASDRQLTLLWDAVIRESDSHYALVAVSGDLARGVTDGDDLLGSFTAGRSALALDRGEVDRMALLTGAMRLGARHIVEGHDHLLFLLVLLLAAPLAATGGRWGPPRPMADTLRHLAWIVTAFTLGHSTTLILAAIFDLRLPTAPVEAAIALSVLVTAVHAVRPLFAGREPAVAFGFGLVHGLAFATVVAGFGASLTTRAIAIGSFNLGIELVQMAIVALLLPALAIGSRTAWYRPARWSLAALAGLAAVVWLGERMSGGSTIAGAWLATVMPLLGLTLIAMSLLVAASAVLRRGRRPSLRVQEV